MDVDMDIGNKSELGIDTKDKMDTDICKGVSQFSSVFWRGVGGQMGILVTLTNMMTHFFL